jgi:hypothetical protein
MQKFTKAIIIMPVLVGISLITGCTKPDNELITPYFHKGVYASYSANKKSQNYFYIFYDENSGHTEGSERAIGLPFSCVQTNKSVKFRFGGIREPEEIFKIKSIKNEVVTGSFDNGEILIFTPIPNENPESFDAAKYTKTSK